MISRRSLLILSSTLVLAACQNMYPPTPRPDYTIRVTPTEKGSVATVPPCPTWTDALANPMDNQPLPQFGCTTAQNLAAQVENPNDLVEGRGLSDTRGVVAVGSIRRYDGNQPRGLIMPSMDSSTVGVTTSPRPNPDISGDMTGGGTSGSARR